MRQWILLSYVFLLVAGTHSVPLEADSYRCGRKLVKSGDTASDLLRVCGKPDHKDRGRESIRIQGRLSNVPVQRWYYSGSSRSLGRVVYIHNGKIVAIDNDAK